MPKKIFMTRSDFPHSAVELLKLKYDVIICSSFPVNQKETFLNNVKGVHAIFCTERDIIDKDILDAAGLQLEVIATMSRRVYHIDIQECKNRKIIVTNVPNNGLDTVAEFVVGLIISVGRNMIEASNLVIKGMWNESTFNTFNGRGLKNSSVGIVGMGEIGLEILKRIASFDVRKCYYHDNFHPNKEAEELGATYCSFIELLKTSDFVIANCFLCDDTREIFNARAFNIMKDTAVFINIDSAELVQQDDLYDALLNGKIRGAGLDAMVPEPLPKNHKLLSLPNIVLSPHIATAEIITITELAKFNSKNIISVLEERKPLTPVY